MHSFKTDRAELFYSDTGQSDASQPLIVWGHGWGQSHAAFDVLIGKLGVLGRHISIDFPGFGQAPIPFQGVEHSWASADYAGFVSDFIRARRQKGQPVIWVGHSFGCRVGTQLAALYPDVVDAMVFIAGAGIKRKRSLVKKMFLWSKVRLYKMGKFLKAIPGVNNLLTALGVLSSHGSSDYQNAGDMRGVLVKVVNENLVAEAQKIQCPVLLIYGDNDDETPVDIGQSFNKMIKDSQLICLEGQDHYSVLDERGSHQVALRMKQFVEKVCVNND